MLAEHVVIDANTTLSCSDHYCTLLVRVLSTFLYLQQQVPSLSLDKLSLSDLPPAKKRRFNRFNDSLDSLSDILCAISTLKPKYIIFARGSSPSMIRSAVIIHLSNSDDVSVLTPFSKTLRQISSFLISSSLSTSKARRSRLFISITNEGSLLPHLYPRNVNFVFKKNATVVSISSVETEFDPSQLNKESWLITNSIELPGS
ncbi:hypothetical protein P9112_012613 [Eukaryota sp. TZLM1-RC]